MTHRERLIRTLKCEKIGGQVPTFELVFFLTMEAFGRVHMSQRAFWQWDQMSRTEQTLHIRDIADLYIQIARRYGHSAIFVDAFGGNLPVFQRLLEEIRTQSGDEYFLLAHGDPTWAIPDGDHMTEFSVKMFEAPDELNDESQRRLDQALETAYQLDRAGHLLDGFGLCSDYCFNVNPFFPDDLFGTLIAPYLKAVLDGYGRWAIIPSSTPTATSCPFSKRLRPAARAPSRKMWRQSTRPGIRCRFCKCESGMTNRLPARGGGFCAAPRPLGADAETLQ